MIALVLVPLAVVLADIPRGVRATLRADAPCAAAYGILADVAAYPEFMPSVKRVRIVKEGPGWADIVFEYKQLSGATQHRVFDPPHGIRWQTIEGAAPQIKAMSGYWGFFAPADGATGSCDVVYELHVETRFPVPSFLVSRAMRPVVEGTVEAVGRRIASGGTWKKPRS